MKIEIPMSQFGSHGCNGVAVLNDDGTVTFEEECHSSTCENGFLWSGAAIAALHSLAAHPEDAALWEYHEAF